MNTVQIKQIESTLGELYADSKLDYIRMMKGAAKSMFGSFKPANFKDVYLSISQEQGRDLVDLIIRKKVKNIVEFGTSFGISTLFLAKGAIETKGKIVTTELIESKAKRAIENFKRANVNHLIDTRIGDAIDTLKDYNEHIDLLLLDGWKDLYLSVFKLLESNFHKNTIIYVDNADMPETKRFLATVARDIRYKLESLYEGKVVLITISQE